MKLSAGNQSSGLIPSTTPAAVNGVFKVGIGDGRIVTVNDVMIGQ